MYMNAAATGIPNADVEELYRKYWPMVLIRCRSILGDAENAADAAQEVFVKILEKRNILTAEYPSSLLWTMATNHCLDVLKSRAHIGKVHGGGTLLNKIASSLDIEVETGNRDLLRKLFGRHPKKTYAIAVMHLVDGMTIKEVAQEAGLSVRTVVYRLQALRQTLRKLACAEVNKLENL